MGSAVSPLPHPTTAQPEEPRLKLTPERQAQRIKRRRQVQIVIALSYGVDTILLSIYAYAGTISPRVPEAYLATALLSVAAYLVLSEIGINDRFRDHYLVGLQSGVSTCILLTFAYLAPQVGVLFLCSLFTVAGSGSLRSAPYQSAANWGLIALALGALFLVSGQPPAMPLGSSLERLVTLLTFVTNIGRCMFLGLLASTLRQSLYQSGLKLKEAYRRIEELAELDELTGSFNRRCIMRLLDEQIGMAREQEMPCSIALIDLDWFKRINDVYGHPVGDEVLRTFAITMFANIRSVDRFGRYGGEEFLLVLPGTGPGEAERMVDRLRGVVGALDWSAFSPTLEVTMSSGIAAYREGDNTDSLLARADTALYRAKAKGRNRTVSEGQRSDAPMVSASSPTLVPAG